MLLIGFEDKPRGTNPLTKRKSPINLRPKFANRSPSPIEPPQKKLDMEKKNEPRQLEESENVLETNFMTP